MKKKIALILAVVIMLASLPAIAERVDSGKEIIGPRPIVPPSVMPTIGPRVTFDHDLDHDGVPDETDPDVKSNVYLSTVIHKKPSASIDTSYPFTYKWDYSVFEGDPSQFDYELCRLSSLIAGLGYHRNQQDDASASDDQYFVTNSLGNSMSLPQLMQAHGMTVEEHNLHAEYGDKHVTLVDLGLYRQVVPHGERDIVLIAMRGSNGTWAEWSSNFEVGHELSSCDPDFIQYKYGSDPEWRTADNHMGFDITANRVLEAAESFVEANGLDPQNVVFWVTGHSRGAAIANICASELIKRGNKTFAYTFACPNTTLSTDASSYTGIFNIVNEDDLVPYLPFTEWGFNRYGKTAVIDMTSAMQDEWSDMMGESYDHAESTLDNALSLMSDLISYRDEAYVYTCSCHGNGSDDSIMTSNWYFTESNREKGIAKTPACLNGYYKLELEDGVFYWTYHCQPMIFFMQMLAAYMSGQMTTLEFGDYDIADKYETAKWSLALAAVWGVGHPHYCESYFIAADEVTASSFH